MPAPSPSSRRAAHLEDEHALPLGVLVDGARPRRELDHVGLLEPAVAPGVLLGGLLATTSSSSSRGRIASIIFVSGHRRTARPSSGRRLSAISWTSRGASASSARRIFSPPSSSAAVAAVVSSVASSGPSARLRDGGPRSLLASGVGDGVSLTVPSGRRLRCLDRDLRVRASSCHVSTQCRCRWLGAIGLPPLLLHHRLGNSRGGHGDDRSRQRSSSALEVQPLLLHRALLRLELGHLLLDAQLRCGVLTLGGLRPVPEASLLVLESLSSPRGLEVEVDGATRRFGVPLHALLGSVHAKTFTTLIETVSLISLLRQDLLLHLSPRLLVPSRSPLD